MTIEQILNRFFQVVSYDLRHKHYKHVVAKKKLYKQLVAGVGMDDLLRQYVRRESKELFEQRVRLTQHISKSVCKKLLDPFNKVPRSNSARRILTYKGDKNVESKTAELEGLLDGFWGNMSFDDFMAIRYTELNSTDPNAFIVYEFDDYDATVERLQPKPFEVSCDKAIDFKVNNNVLIYLIVRDSYKTLKKKKIHRDIFGEKIENPDEIYHKLSKFTLYTSERNYQLYELPKDIEDKPFVEQPGVPFNAVVDGEEVQLIKLKDKLYKFITLDDHGCSSVPAHRVGYNRDLATDGQTFVNQIDAAEPYILKSIKTNSELDLVATLLAFPQQLRFADPCQDEKCYNGKYNDGSTCPTCNGTGLSKGTSTAQDAIVLKAPRSKEEMIPLKEYMTYLHPDVAIVKWQEDYIDKLVENASRVMYGSEAFTKKQVSETATGKNLDMQNVYDTLYPFAVAYARRWMFGVTTCAELSELNDDLVRSYSFGKDFKLKSLDTLMVDLRNASEINNTSLQKHINDDIAQIIFHDKQVELRRYYTESAHDPFAGKSEKEVIVLLASNLVPRLQKVIHANYSMILDALELEYATKKGSKGFYELNRVDQRKEIERKGQEILDSIDSEAPSIDFSQEQ